MNIAIIGAGISGLTAAYLLSQSNTVEVFELNAQIGGHTATVDVPFEGKSYAVDTGFIVYNTKNYRNFIRLMDRLGVASQPGNMSFSVSDPASGLEWASHKHNPGTLFAQRRNLFNPRFLGMLGDVLRFNRQAPRDLDSGRLHADMTLGQYMEENGYGRYFRNYYLIPMASAIWSASRNDAMALPLVFFIKFFRNHGLLQLLGRPQWRVIRGGSKSYLQPLTEGFRSRIHCNAKIASVARGQEQVTIQFQDGQARHFDQIVFACHSDQALKLLHDPTPEETDILGAIPYRENSVILHHDGSLLPRNRKIWSAWNYKIGANPDAPPTLSYNMNILQSLNAPTTFIVSLNAKERIDKNKILGEYRYAHPVFNQESVAAQARRSEISGKNRTWYCGAYWHNGFHEDGCQSGIQVAEALGAKWGA